MAFPAATANDVANAALIFYIREKMLTQTTQDKPLLRFLRDNSKTFPGGNLQLSVPVQGAYMSDSAAFLQGYSGNDAVTFAEANSMLRAVYNWKEVHAGLDINWTELKIDGIMISDHQAKSDHSDSEVTRLTSILENRLEDFGESWARATNKMFWQDGTQDAKQIPGIQAILTDSGAVGTVGGLNKATYAWWRQRVNLAIPVSAAGASLVQFLNSEWLQLCRFGGKPSQFFCGSQFLDALRLELVGKGFFTQTGFNQAADTDIGIAQLKLNGMVFNYDPTLDDLGLGKRCYALDKRRVVLRPMEGEDNKVLTPERPYNYMMFIKSMTFTGALIVSQQNANGVYAIA